MSEFQKEQTIFEAANNGRFEKIYPLPVKEAAESGTWAKFDSNLTLDQKQEI